jgi:hypothetical protein
VAEFVCGVEEKNPNYLSACKNLPEYQDTGYCVLHFPGEEEKEDFEQALVYSLGAVARLNPKPRPTEPGLFQFLVIVEGLLGPLQIALLALAVPRRIMRWDSKENAAMHPDPQRLEDISSIRDAMRQISQEASVAVDLLDAKVEDGLLDGRTEAGDVRAILELIQALTLEVSEDLDSYQERYSRP